MDLQYVIETDKSIYNLGEEVHALHRITNPFDVSVDISLFQSPGFDLWVVQDEEKIWSYQQWFFPVIWSKTIDPGETLEYNYTWDMMDYDDNPVAPGEYEVVGVVYGGGPSVSTPITIIPEPGTLLLMLMGFGAVAGRKRRKSKC